MGERIGTLLVVRIRVVEIEQMGGKREGNGWQVRWRWMASAMQKFVRLPEELQHFSCA